MKVDLFANYSQMIGPKEFKFSGFDGDHPGVVIRKFGEVRIKSCLWVYIPPNIFWLWLQLYA